jgi:hypothetical protein
MVLSFNSSSWKKKMPKQVTWVEHVEIEDKTPTHRLYRDLIHSGLAFGAERWLAVLRRICERFACLMVTGTSTTRDLGGGNFNSIPMMLDIVRVLIK